MLADHNAINKINPYMKCDISLPGTIGEKRKFEKYEPPIEENVELFNDNTFICNHGIVSGDKVIDTCRPSNQKCPLSRPLIPGRNIDLGEGNLGENKVHTYVSPYKIKRKRDTSESYLLLIILIILLLSFLKQ
jgi:hypothetical protein